MEKNSQQIDRIKSNSLSVIRSFVRYALSSIVYNRLSPKTNSRDREQGSQGSQRSQSCTTRKDNDVDSATKIERRSKSDEVTNNDHLNAMKFRNEQHESCFIDKTFCGLDLKFIDAVDENDLIKDENVFKITNWLERVAFPYLEKDMLHALNFVTLSIPLLGQNKNQCKKGRLEVFQFQFQSSQMSNLPNGGIKMMKITEQIQKALSSIIEKLHSTNNSSRINGRHSNQTKCDDLNRFQISMNFILEYKEEKDCSGSQNKDQSFQSLFRDSEDGLNPLEKITMDKKSEKHQNCKSNSYSHNAASCHQNGVFRNEERNEIQEFQNDQEDGDIESPSPSPEANRSYQVLAQQSQSQSDNEDNIASLASVSPENPQVNIHDSRFMFVGKVQSVHHGVIVNHKTIDVDELHLVDGILGRLFGKLPLPYQEVNSNDGTSTNTVHEKNEEEICRTPIPTSGRSAKRERRRLQVPPTLTPMRHSLSPSGLSTGRQCRKRKIIDNDLSCLPPRSSSTIEKSSFVTPKGLRKRKSPFSSSEAPTVVVRLSSLMSSNSPLFSSVTPLKND